MKFAAVAEDRPTLKLALIAILESYRTGCDVAVAVTLPLYKYSLLKSQRTVRELWKIANIA